LLASTTIRLSNTIYDINTDDVPKSFILCDGSWLNDTGTTEENNGGDAFNDDHGGDNKDDNVDDDDDNGTTDTTAGAASDGWLNQNHIMS